MKSKIILFGSLFLLAFTFKSEQIWSPFTQEVQQQLKDYTDKHTPEKIYLQTDRPLYQPGEMIWFSTFIRNADKLTTENISEVVYVELVSPQGTVKDKQTLIAIKGAVGSGFQLEKGDAGGEYTLRAYTNWMRNTEQIHERKIRVQKVVLPNLRMKLDMEREGYGAGETVQANLTLESLENQPLRYHAFAFVVQLAGKEILKSEGKTDFDGKAAIVFDLPKKLNTSDGLLNVKIQHKGQPESIARPIPIILQKIDLQFLPESGNVVANIPTNIAFKALDEFGKPADIAGTIFNEKDIEVGTFESLHNGMGKFAFEAKSKEQYYAKITKPFVGKDKVLLPKAEVNGLIMNMLGAEEGSIAIQLKGTHQQAVSLVATLGEEVFFSERFYLNNTMEQTISTKDMPIGIGKITAFNLAGEPIAERLFFANKHRQLNIDIQTNKEKYAPREEVELNLKITDETGQPVQGNFNIAVADDQLLSYADDKAGNILASLLLESELKGDIHEPNFYFDEEEPQADAALDLLMLTNGWRRYEWANVLNNKDLAIEFEKEQATIAGYVLDEKDEAIANAQITIIQNGTAKTTTDSTGYFELKHVEITNPKQGVKLEIKHTAYATFYEIVNQFNDNLVLQALEGSGSFTGTLATANGKLLSNFEFILEKENAQYRLKTDHEGAFVLQQLPAGNYELKVNYKDYPQNIFRDIPVRGGRNSHVDILVKNKIKVKESAKAEALQLVDNQPIIMNMMTKKVKAPKATSPKKNKPRSGGNEKALFDDIIVSGGAISLESVEVVSYTVPLIEQDHTTQGGVVTSRDIRNLPVRNIHSIATSVAGVTSADEGDALTIRGAREGAATYYIDGIRVSGNLIPETEISQVQVITGGVPARYGGGEAVIPSYIPKGGKVPHRSAGDYGRAGISTPSSDGVGGSAGRRKYSSYSYGYPTWRPRKIPQIIYAMVDEPAKMKLENSTTTSEVEAHFKRYYSYLLRNNQAIKVQFIIDKKGRICGANYWDNRRNRAVSDSYFQQIMEGLPTWKPARKNGVAVASQYTVLLKNNQTAHKGIGNTTYQSPIAYYQPQFTSKKEDFKRTDFPATIFWQANVQTDTKGKASLTFKNYDALTTFRITVEGLGKMGQIGRAEHTFFTQMPFALRAKMPTHILLSDLVKLPVILENNTDEELTGYLNLKLPQCLKKIEFSNTQQTLKAGESKTIYFPLKATQLPAGETEIELTFKTKDAGDILVKKVHISPHGFPIRNTFTGQDVANEFEVNIDELIEGSLEAKLNIYPSMLSEILATAEKLIRQPSGCFEQTSSSNYPNLLALKLLRDGGQNAPKIEAKATQVLKTGYQRLTGYEIKTGGFEWFGRTPAHEALTAYGLLQFNDMKAVYPVEEALIERTANWLLSRRDGKGGWQVQPKSLHTWQTAGEIGNAYIIWALTEAGYGAQIAEIGVCLRCRFKKSRPLSTCFGGDEFGK